MTETIDAMLLEFADRFHLDGDLLRCTSCNRGIVASRQDEDFVHAPSCNLRMVKGRPWSALQAILAGPLVDAMRGAQAESAVLKAKLAALVEALTMIARPVYGMGTDAERADVYVRFQIIAKEALAAAKVQPSAKHTHQDLRTAGVNNHDEGRVCGLCGGDVPSGCKHEHGHGVCRPAKEVQP